MSQRSLVTVLAALGGILVILGGILGFLLSIGPNGYGPRFDGAVDALVLGLLAIVFGVLILVYSGYTHYQGVDRSVTGGLILVVLGIVTWVVVGGWVLIAAGSFLTVVAGLALMFQVMFAEPNSHSSGPQ
ncbi:MAG: hypothetical protein L3K03_08540 [Thermoplasmata archaeon]|nr:hypothetical protein [Thermoplasmata archaeon]